jgi:protein-tyrosine phosphatase
VYQADSAGTTDYHVGESPDPRMLKEAGKHGLTYDGRARLISWDDFDRFDLILALDRENYAELMSYVEAHPTYKDKIHLLREFDPQAEGDLDVPDPYYGGNKGFSHTYEIVDRAIQGLLDTLQESRR